MFPSTLSRETSRLSGKQSKLFSPDYTLSVYYASGAVQKSFPLFEYLLKRAILFVLCPFLIMRHALKFNFNPPPPPPPEMPHQKYVLGALCATICFSTIICSIPLCRTANNFSSFDNQVTLLVGQDRDVIRFCHVTSFSFFIKCFSKIISY